MIAEGGLGILGRLSEKVLGWIALVLLILLGIAAYQIGWAGWAMIWTALWKTVVWMAIVGAIPWSSRLFIDRILETGSNWASAVVLVAFVLIDVVVSLVILDGLPSGVWAWVAALAALGVAGGYNY